MEERHECYFIWYEDKDCDWEEMFLYRSDDELEDFKRIARELAEDGHRNVKVMEEVTVERLVATIEGNC